MLHWPKMNPIAFHIGPIPVHWYGLMYLFGFLAGWALLCVRAKRDGSSWTTDEVSDLLFYVALGVVIGGRLGYMLFYDFSDWMQQPLLVFKTWDGGMSFHGGMLGVAFSVWLFARIRKKSWFQVLDFVIPVVPLGLGAGRIGNFINGELWGRVTDVPWGMIFPQAGPLPRHPSQLYEFLLEGVVLFVILWLYSSKTRPRGRVTALFLICYGVFRFFVEWFRQPDSQLGFIAFGWLTRGQELSLPMIIIGLVLWFVAVRKGRENG